MTARDSAHRAARTLLRLRTIVIAGYALSAAVACVGVVTLATAEGLSKYVAYPLAGASVALVWSVFLHGLLRSRPNDQQTVKLADADAPELALLVRQLSLQLQVPTPSGIELSPGCDAWLDPRPDGAVLVIGSPFVWWLRVSELRGLLAPLVAGMAAADDERIARARRFASRVSARLRGGSGLAAAIAVADGRGRRLWPRLGGRWRSRLADYCEAQAELLERAVALEAVAASRLIEPAARASAHEQINLAAAGWDRVLTRLAAPAWESGIRPTGLNVALVGALTSLGRRDRLAGALATRLSERPACDLLEEPGRIDAAVSQLAAQVFDGRPADRHVQWERYVAVVAEPEIRARAASVPEIHPAAKLVRSLISGGRPSTESTDLAASDTEAQIEPLDPDLLAAYVSCHLADAHLAKWTLDWLDGPVLRDRRGDAVPVQDIAVALADIGDTVPLSDWLAART